MSAPSAPRFIGIAWYRADEWTMLRALVPDGDQLQPSHAEWLKDASTQVYDLQERGFVVRKIDVHLPDLLRWCEAQHLAPDSQARAAFATAGLEQSLRPATHTHRPADPAPDGPPPSA